VRQRAEVQEVLFQLPVRIRFFVGASLLAKKASAPHLPRLPSSSLTTIAGKPAPTKECVMVSRLRSYSYLLMLAVGLSGCTSWFADDTPPPQIHLVKVELVRAKLLEQKFKLHFRVDNRGDSDLTVRGLIYKISLADVELTEGESNEWLTIAPHGRGFFKVTVRTNLWPQVREIADLLKNPDRPIPYRLEGELKTGLFIGNDVHVMRNDEIIPGDFIPERHQ
jgi:LEA14-like dessication related protein